LLPMSIDDGGNRPALFPPVANARFRARVLAIDMRQV